MKARYKASCAIAAILAGCGYAASAAAAEATADTTGAGTAVEEIVVTAERRNESVQNVPMTVQAITGTTLSQLNVNTVDDILRYTPNVSYGNNGPGQGEIYMRGLSTGFRGNQSSATVGNFPNVAIYLDDQSMQFPARNVDIYIADMDRIEVLEGPQGTLFGGGAEAGAVRYITNKPKLDVFEGHAEAGYAYTDHGDESALGNFTLNVPIIPDRFAVRAVVYDERRGGYIDNVPSTFTRSNEDLGNYYFNIKPTGGVCPNGLPAGAAGLCTVANAPQANNFGVAHNAQNPTTYTGARFEALFKVNDDWDVLITESLQDLDAEGLSVQYPVGSDFQQLAPLQVTAFNPSYDKDKFWNTAWTVNGKVGPIKAIYTGGYMVRHISQQMEYSNYSRTGGGMYYECTGGSTGWGTAAPACYSPSVYWQDTVRNTHLSNEIRFQTPDTWRLRGIVGGYFEQFRIYDIQNFNYKTIPACSPANLAVALAGGPVCVADVRTAPGSTANDPGIRSDATAFGEDTQRGYDQTAFFGSVDFDIIPHVLTISGGTRYYRYSEFEVGSQYGTGAGCLNVPNGQCVGGLVNIDAANDHVVYTGFKSRANVTWHITPDVLTYFTFSQGFRPGGFNRSQKSVIPDANGAKQYKEPNAYAPDSLNNYEIGVKSELFEHRLQLNLSAYYMDWSNVQFLLFNPTEQINTTFGLNGPSYNVKGVEAQFVAKMTEHLTVQGSGSYNYDRQSNSPCLVDNIAGTAAFGHCITQVRLNSGAIQAFANPFGSAGSVPAFSPAYQFNMRARYDWDIGAYHAHVTLGGNYVDSMYNQPATYPSGVGVLIPSTTYLRYLQPAYGTIDASIGIARDKWFAEVYGQNLTNSNASTFTSSAQFIKSEVPLRPLVIGLKVGADF
ncbi:MAG TPA: TonB-dependent receptor [Caulobacteraceae bacterium]|nr:TonB-dependent receptor [Caulobacteraceae bacterium]